MQSGRPFRSWPVLAQGHRSRGTAVAHKARHEASDDLGMTALHWSAAYGLEAVASTLLEQGANKQALSLLLVSPGELALLNAHAGLTRTLGARMAVSDVGFAIIRRLSAPRE
jgi:hypothetical protein